MHVVSALFLLSACGDPPVAPTAPAPTPPPEAPAGSDVPPDAQRLPEQDGQSVTLSVPSLEVRVTAHTVAGTPCWTFLSDGLPGREIAVTVRRDRATELSPILHFIQASFEQPPALGEAQGMAPDGPGFLGRGRFYTAYFGPPVPLAAVDGTDQALAVTLLDAAERDALYTLGPTRLLARLGALGGHPPTAPWADPERPAVASADELSSELASIPALFLPTLTVTHVGDTVRLALGPADLQRLRNHETTGPERPVRLLGTWSPTTDGLLVHRPGEPDVAIGPEASSRQTIALNGLLLSAPGEPGVGFIEDLAGLVLAPGERATLIATLERGAGAELALGDQTVTVADSPWLAWVPSPLAAAPAQGTAQVLGVTLALSADEVAQRVPTDTLRTAIGLAEIEVLTHVQRHPAPVASMDIEVLYAPGEPPRYHPHWPDEADHAEWWSGLQAALGTLTPPEVSGPVAYRMKLVFGR